MSASVKLFYPFLKMILLNQSIYLSYQISTFITIGAAAVIYFITLLLLQEIKYNDIAMVPVIGKKTAERLKQIGLVGEKNE